MEVVRQQDEQVELPAVASEDTGQPCEEIRAVCVVEEDRSSVVATTVDVVVAGRYFGLFDPLVRR
jgi:hypothetical protein